MKIGFIGAGKVGFSLGKYFVEHKVNVSGYYSRTIDSSKEAAEFTKTKCYETIEDLIFESDILFITVPDGIIREVYENISQSDIKGKCLVHCSGALSSEVFSGISNKGAVGCSVHPICAVSNKLTGYQELSKAYFTIEGNGVQYAEELLRKCGNHFEIISSDKKIKYHASAVFASNLVVGVYDMATNILRECGLSREFSENALKSLFKGNAENIVSKGVTQALTGPVERADGDTVNKHLDALDNEEKEIYRLLSKVLIDIAKQKNPDRDYNELERMVEK